MDLANYLSELLGQHGQISFPGLGNFVRVRVDGYYNERDGKFYPPFHRVKFNPVPVEDDDTFASYIARKKNISLASSKYFAEKYTSKLKEQAAINQIAFADLGWFSSDGAQLVFKPNDKITADPSFYGYEPLQIHKLSQQAVAASGIKNIYAEAEASPVATSAPAYQPPSYQPYEDDEIVPGRRISIWMVLLFVIILIALALFGIYKFNPELFDKLKAQYHKIADREAAPVKQVARLVAKTHTVNYPVNRDTTGQKTATQKLAADSAAKVTAVNSGRRYELLGGAFKTTSQANAVIKNYKKNKIDARIVNDLSGNLVKITLGTYQAREDAVEAKQKLIKAGKLTDDEVIIQPYN